VSLANSLVDQERGWKILSSSHVPRD
jgi:hypothetical protein